jgi:Family of unknown function (DUF6221)
MDLTEWLLGQIGDDEERLDRLTSDELFDDDQLESGPPAIDVGFLLADLDAKRRIVFEHRPVNIALSYPLCATCLDHVATDDEGAWAIGKAWPCQTLRLVALPFASRDGYLDEWRDTGTETESQTEGSDEWRDEGD